MTIGRCKVKTTTTARSLGVWFDRNMKFDTNIRKMCVMEHLILSIQHEGNKEASHKWASSNTNTGNDNSPIRLLQQSPSWML